MAKKTNSLEAEKAAVAAAKAAAEKAASDKSTDKSEVVQAQAEATPVAEPAKKKKKRPGVPPSVGKKLKTKLRGAVNEIIKQGALELKKAIAYLKQHKRAKFDETVGLHMALGIDPKQNDQVVRGSVPLPHGLGKSKKVLVFCQGDNITKAKEAGADFVGGDDLAKKIQSENWTDFDVALTTPDMMGIVGRLGKILGPRGLMPSPKAGTVVTGDIVQAIKEQKAGKVEFRADGGGNVHAPVGKISFEEAKLADNINAFIDAIKAAKPAAAKGVYIKSVTLSATMSPGVPVLFTAT